MDDHRVGFVVVTPLPRPADRSRTEVLLTTDTPDFWFRGETFIITLSESISTLTPSVITVKNGTVASLAPVPGSSNFRWSFKINTPANLHVTIQILFGAFTDFTGEVIPAPLLIAVLQGWNLLPVSTLEMDFCVFLCVFCPGPDRESERRVQHARCRYSQLSRDVGADAWRDSVLRQPPVTRALCRDVPPPASSAGTNNVTFVPAGNAIVTSIVTDASDSSNATLLISIVVLVDGPLTMVIPAGVCRDVFGNYNLENHTDIIYDDTWPTVVITTTTPYFARLATMQRFVLTFSEIMLPLTAAMVNSSQGVASDIVRTTRPCAANPARNCSVDTLTFAPTVEGVIAVTLDDLGCTDLEHNPITHYSFLFVYDVTPPTISLQTATPYFANASSLSAFFALSSEPYGYFNASSVSIPYCAVTAAALLPGVANASIGRFTFLPSIDTLVTVSMTAVDRAGNGNYPSTLTFVYDTTPPTGRVTSLTPFYSRVATLQSFKATFSEPIVPFDGTHVYVENGAAVNVQVVDTQPENTTFVFDVVPSVANGTIRVAFPPAFVTDRSLNGNLYTLANDTTVAAPQPFVFVYDAQPPQSYIYSNGVEFEGSVKGSPFLPQLVIQFNEFVCCISMDSIQVTAARVVAVTAVDSSNTSFTIDLTPTVIKDTVTVLLVPGSVVDHSGNGNDPSRVHSLSGEVTPFVINYDNTPFPIAAVVVSISLLLSALAVVALTLRWKKMQFLGAKTGEHARRAMVNVNRIDDVEIDHVTVGRHAKTRIADNAKGVAFWAPGGWMRYGVNDNLA